MLYAAKFGLNGWGLGFDLMLNLMDDLLVNHPIKLGDNLGWDFLQMSLGLEVVFDFGFTNLCGVSRVEAQINRV